MPPRPATSSMRCPAKTDPVASSLTPSGLATSGGPGNRTPTCGFGDRHPDRWTSPPGRAIVAVGLELPAGVVELADTPALGAGAARFGGSSPSARIVLEAWSLPEPGT